MSRGGFRPGAGRKENSGPFQEKTVVRRIPLSIATRLDSYCQLLKTEKCSLKAADVLDDIFMVASSSMVLPFFSSKVAAGVPFAADENIDSYLDLNAHLISKPTTSFFVKVSGDSMILAGINDGDILIVDRSLQAKNGSIVIAVLNSELTVKRLKLEEGRCYLIPENDTYNAIEVTTDMDFIVWGVVTSVIHQF